MLRSVLEPSAMPNSTFRLQGAREPGPWLVHNELAGPVPAPGSTRPFWASELAEPLPHVTPPRIAYPWGVFSNVRICPPFLFPALFSRGFDMLGRNLSAFAQRESCPAATIGEVLCVVFSLQGCTTEIGCF